jgi:hypothetical protein
MSEPMPAALAAILEREEFRVVSPDGAWMLNIGPVRIEVYRTGGAGEDFDVLCETRKSYSVAAIDLVRAGGLVDEIEQAIAASEGAGV